MSLPAATLDYTAAALSEGTAIDRRKTQPHTAGARSGLPALSDGRGSPDAPAATLCRTRSLSASGWQIAAVRSRAEEGRGSAHGGRVVG